MGLLSDKRREVGDKAFKLKGGLTKLGETGVQVRGWLQPPCTAYTSPKLLSNSGSCTGMITKKSG